MTALRTRVGQRPTTTSTLPHRQVDQQPADPAVGEELARRAFALPGVVEAPSKVSVPGARALVATDHAAGPTDAFIVDREFAHLHPRPDESLHLVLPLDLARAAVDSGWAERHPLAGTESFAEGLVMVYAPRDGNDLEVVWSLLAASHEYATRGGDR